MSGEESERLNARKRLSSVCPESAPIEAPLNPEVISRVYAIVRPACRTIKKAGGYRPFEYRKNADYLTCLPIRPAISNIDTCGLPNTASSFLSALIMRLLALSCRLLALM